MALGKHWTLTCLRAGLWSCQLLGDNVHHEDFLAVLYAGSLNQRPTLAHLLDLSPRSCFWGLTLNRLLLTSFWFMYRFLVLRMLFSLLSWCHSPRLHPLITSTTLQQNLYVFTAQFYFCWTVIWIKNDSHMLLCLNLSHQRMMLLERIRSCVTGDGLWGFTSPSQSHFVSSCCPWVWM